MAIKPLRGIGLAILASLWPAMPLHAGPEPAGCSSPEALQALAHWDPDRLVDLTHAFRPGIPHSEALGDEVIEPLFSHEPGVGTLGSGASLDRYTLVGQWGTHVDPPVHFIEGLRTLEDIGLKEMILPLVVIDIHLEVVGNPDYTVSMTDVRRWEERHGAVPAGSFVALRTDWSNRWPDPEAFFNRDAEGLGHYPGWSKDVLRYLDEERNVTAIGHETSDTDPGIIASQGRYPLETWHLQHDKYQIEMLDNLDRVPEAGAVIIATWPRVSQGSGFPARVFALLP